jgi:hypothetical protein
VNTELSLCACVGPQGSDPVCPCRMRSGSDQREWVRFDQDGKEERIKLIRKVIAKHRDVLEKLKDR